LEAMPKADALLRRALPARMNGNHPMHKPAATSRHSPLGAIISLTGHINRGLAASLAAFLAWGTAFLWSDMPDSLPWYLCPLLLVAVAGIGGTGASLCFRRRATGGSLSFPEANVGGAAVAPSTYVAAISAVLGSAWVFFILSAIAADDGSFGPLRETLSDLGWPQLPVVAAISVAVVALFDFGHTANGAPARFTDRTSLTVPSPRTIARQACGAGLLGLAGLGVLFLFGFSFSGDVTEPGIACYAAATTLLFASMVMEACIRTESDASPVQADGGEAAARTPPE